MPGFLFFIIHLFQVPKHQLQQMIGNNNKKGQASVVVEETVKEDARFPEQVAKEIIIRDGTLTHISAGQYNGFIQGSC